MEFELINVLGKEVASPEMQAAIAKHGLTNPKTGARRYYASKKGFDLLAEAGQLVDIQIFVQPKGRLAFSEPLPFGIQKGMSQEQVHQLLGPPAKSSKFDSLYEMPEIGARMMVCYDDSLNVKYISIAVPKELRKRSRWPQ